MNYTTISASESDEIFWITFNRPKNQNSINSLLLEELNHALDWVETYSRCQVIVLQGKDGFFSSGMDFSELVGENSSCINQESKNNIKNCCELYFKTIKRFTYLPKIIISNIQGKALAGGIGLVSAGDFAIASPDSQFSLPEVLWGMMPAMVLPFLIRRVGSQEAYKMALTSVPVTAKQALEIKLIDEVSENPEGSIRRLALRLTRIDKSSISNLKRYFMSLWNINGEIEHLAVSETIRLMCDPAVREKIFNFIKYKRLPWEI